METKSSEGEISQIRKRDGRLVKFDQEKITNAIFKAIQAVGGDDRTVAQSISDQVVSILRIFYRDGRVPAVEEVQDLVEKVLIENGQAETAKAYILYRAQRAKLRRQRSVMMDIRETIGDYLNQSDWRVNENSNSDYSLSGLLMHAAGAAIANYTLEEVYPPEIADAHRSGHFHIHDLGMGITGYCAGWSLRQLLLEGFNGVPNKVGSAPPKHLETALGQMVNFLGTLQNEWAGAMAFSSFDTYLAPFVRKDALEFSEVKQSIQQFVFSLNVASRWGGQTPFTNLTFDWTVPEDLREEHAIVGGQLIDEKYGDYQREMDMINQAFLEVMTEGDMTGRVFTFPIPTYNITKDFDWDNKNAELLFEMTAKYGLPYFQNFIRSDLNPGDVRSMCCRLQLDLRELRKKTGGLFGFGESTGSIGVVTINMSRLGYLSNSQEEFFQRLDRLMALAKNSLEIKRKLVKRNMEEGLLPYTKRYLDTLDNHFSTIGLIGMNEACLNLLGKDIATAEGKKLALQVLDFMRNRIQDFQEETGNIYNLEATPAEGASYRLAKLDKEKFPDIITAGEQVPYYTNSTLLPVGKTDDIFEALEHQEELQAKYTGGTVFHVFLGERMPSGQACKNLIRRIVSNFRIPYITITPTFSICRTHGYLKGEQPECPICHQPTEVYSRVVGYYRPVVNWNVGKKEELRQRLEYEVDELTSSLEHRPASEGKPESGSSLIQSYKFFFSDRCPQCSLAKAYVEKLDLPGENIDARTPQGLEEARKYDVRSTPTVLLFDNRGHPVEAASTLSEIKDAYKRLTENLPHRLSRKDSLDLVPGRM
ncbi:MAG: ribonucleoside triphosphate reductase [Candidatus Latescibacterota bacterium]|nr:MAG: ribonucleoside triphosphate reductase [Candidatus Latescibacterota bacterium]